MADTILIIESDDTLRRELASALSKAGFAVVAVPDYAKALQKLDELNPDMVVMNNGLPGGDGMEACCQLHSTLGIPVLLLGEDSSNEVWARLMECGDVHYEIKPCSYAILVARVKAILRRHKAWKATDRQSRLMLFRTL